MTSSSSPRPPRTNSPMEADGAARHVYKLTEAAAPAGTVRGRTADAPTATTITLHASKPVVVDDSPGNRQRCHDRLSTRNDPRAFASPTTQPGCQALRLELALKTLKQPGYPPVSTLLSINPTRGRLLRAEGGQVFPFPLGWVVQVPYFQCVSREAPPSLYSRHRAVANHKSVHEPCPHRRLVGI